MKAIPDRPGRVAVSTQGHDQGRWYVITQVVDERMVLVSDGDIRKLEHPKRKQIKHLRATPVMLDALTSGTVDGRPTQDADIRKALRQLKQQDAARQSAATAQQEKEECAFVQE